ncbi:hypothetical protein IE53DRAFT_386266 [Violaceomyces palustris]|uniref:Uncharacterized protein n=1 Tax=Violaceomyces palustris TaxID=1673888 RepID=A0ACD0NZY9_9BASI|nr:hypothetical protein IE53DRAFT_386266 [Violaceomyces palustris]
MSTPEHKGKKPLRGEGEINSNRNQGRGGPRGRGRGGKARGGRGGGTGTARPKFQKPQSAENGLPGASKLKASIRQTKRLLAKENLAPGVKIEAERRLATLTQDLEKQERANVEKNRASKYHKIKFFERQKLIRRIRKIQRSLRDREQGKEEVDGELGTTEELEKRLFDFRALLHYVLTYPADLRYVALFASNTSEPVAPLSTDGDKSRSKAAEVLEKVRKGMKEGRLSNTPEVDLEKGERSGSHGEGVEKKRKSDSLKEKEGGVNAKKSRKEGAEESGSESDEDEDSEEEESDSDEEESESESDEDQVSEEEEESTKAKKGVESKVKGDDFFASDSEED